MLRDMVQSIAKRISNPGRRARLLGQAGVVTLLVVLSGCGKFFPPQTSTSTSGSGGSGSSTSGDYLYVANANTSLNTIAGYALSGGLLSNTGSSPYDLGVTPYSLAMNPANTLLYVSDPLSGIYVYSVATTGVLTLLNGGPVASVGAENIVIDPSGNWLLALQDQANGSGPVVSVFSINSSTGVLTTEGNPLPLDTGTAGQMLFVPSTTATTNYLAYATLGTGGIDAMTFNTSTGTLGKLNVHYNTLGNAYSDNGVATNPAGTFLFVTETGTNGIRSFTINTTGTLTELSTSPLQNTGSGVGAALVDATGSFLYVANSAANPGSISAFSISSAGALTPVAGSPFTTGLGPSSLVEDNSNGYLAVTCEGGTPDMQVFAINASTGALTSSSTATTGSVSPAGAFAVVATH
jgi:6-phosphogluconolactonase (cycloisomerase 2 family)